MLAAGNPAGAAGFPERAARGRPRPRGPGRGEAGQDGSALPGGLGDGAAVPAVPVSRFGRLPRRAGVSRR